MKPTLPSILITLCLSALAMPLAATTGPWLDANQSVLPFNDEAQMLDFLAHAEITASKVISQGINKSQKLTLERDGLVAHGVFRSVSIEHRQGSARSHPSRNTFRDSYIFEKAAYELSQLLDLDRVPPTVVRTIDGKEGTLQLWVEQATTEASAIQGGGKAYGNAGLRHLQKQVMLVFDNLVYNFDRHQNNMLYDRNKKLWFIDHTRSFRGRPELPARDKLAVVDSDLLDRLRNVDEEAMRDTLSPYLNRIETDAVIKRKRLLVKRFEKLLGERGNDSVLYNLAEITTEVNDITERRLAGSAPMQPSPSAAASRSGLVDWDAAVRRAGEVRING